ncbi:MAG: TonB-dependent receptor [Gammaproteobacteria bacterium]
MHSCFRGIAGPLVGCVLIASPVATFAEQAPIVVTATRVARTADETLASVTVITREQINRSQAGSLGELLQGIAGVNIVNQGGSGKLTSLYLRGTNPGHVAVLVDGIRMGSVTSGTVAWEFLPLAQVERIEVVRGPNSALYGTEAIGGVIQIFTRRGDGPPRHSVAVGGGRYASLEADADISGSTDNGWYSARIARTQTDGFDARVSTIEFGSPVDDPDNDAYDNTSASLRLGHRFANGTEIEFNGLHAAGNTEYDTSAPYANKDDFVQQALGTTVRMLPADNWDMTFSAGRSLDKRDSFRPGTPGSEFTYNTERLTLSLQNDFTLASEDVLSVGIDYHDDRIDSTTVYNETSRATTAGFIQYQGEIAQHSLLARVRRLHDEQFGNRNTGNLAWGYPLGATTRVTASYGTAYKAPTFNDLYFPDFMGFPSSNPNLRPETSASLEVGLEGRTGQLDWDVRAFRTDIKDLIVFDLATFLPGNVNDALIKGVELAVSGVLLDWDTSATATLLDAQDNATGNDLPRRARHSVRLDLDRTFGRTGLGATVIAQSSRYDDAGNTIRVGGFAVYNVRGTYQMGRGLTLQGRIDNLFDKNYQTVSTYNTPGRSLFLGIRYDSEG